MEKTIDSKVIYEGKIIKLRKDKVELGNNSLSTREIIEHPGGAAILATNDLGEIYFVKQFRTPFGIEILELPAGKIDIGEDPLDTAKRELLEETGLVAQNWEYVTKIYPTVGYSNEIIYLFNATQLVSYKQSLDEDEFLDVIKIKIDDVKKMIDSRQLFDAKTLVLLLYFFQHH